MNIAFTQIRELEFGVTETVAAEELRLLDKSYFKSMPAHAIHCRLRLPEPFNSRLDDVFVPGSAESSKSAVILKELVKEKTCFATLKNHRPVPGVLAIKKIIYISSLEIHVILAMLIPCFQSDNYIWEVDLSLGQRENEFAKVAVLDVGERVLKKLAKVSLFEQIFT